MTFSLKRYSMKKLIVWCLLAVGTAAAAQEAKTPRPNVVLVLIDNQGYHELSRNGHQIVKTPQMDNLSQVAVNFTNFHAPPFCSPSRAALLTGRYALRAGIYNTIGGVSILHKNETTVASMLKQAGYQTGVFGKWHLGASYPYAPRFRGFDEVFVHGGGGVSQLGDYYGNDHIDATYQHNGKFVKSEGFSTDVLFDQAIRFIDEKKQGEQPYFCYITTPAVHFPTNRHPETTRRLLERGAPDDKFLALLSMIENVDDNIGKLLEYLKESNQLDNTLLIVASDQGVNDRGAPSHRSGQFQNRGLSYDEKHHVYCMIQYPPLTTANGGDTDQLTGMVDITPTILDICGVEPAQKLDGQSLKPILAANHQWDNERKLIIQCPRSRTLNKWENTAVKYQKWRLVDGEKLYNTETDYGQLNDVAGQNPQLVKELTAAYEKFWQSLPEPSSLLAVHVLGHQEAPDTRLVAMDWYRGGAPWTQQSLKNRSAQGVWKVEIAREGTYRFELRHFPREHPMPIEAETATVQIGDRQKTIPLKQGVDEAVIYLHLEEGVYDFTTTFENKDTENSWGANFVHVHYIE